MKKNNRFTILWIGFSLITLFCSITSSLAQSTLEGTWKNTDEDVRLKILGDRSGSYGIGNKEFAFKEPCNISASGSIIHLEFKITVGVETKTVYALIKDLSPSQIKFIGFLDKEEKDSAIDEIKNSGIILTKSND